MLVIAYMHELYLTIHCHLHTINLSDEDTHPPFVKNTRKDYSCSFPSLTIKSNISDEP